MAEENAIEVYAPIKRPVSARRLLVFLLAAIVNGAGIWSGAEALSELAPPTVLSAKCAGHLLDTEEFGMRRLVDECNNEYRVLIRRLRKHIHADAELVQDMIEEEERRRE